MRAVFELGENVKPDIKIFNIYDSETARGYNSHLTNRFFDKKYYQLHTDLFCRVLRTFID